MLLGANLAILNPLLHILLVRLEMNGTHVLVADDEALDDEPLRQDVREALVSELLVRGQVILRNEAYDLLAL